MTMRLTLLAVALGFAVEAVAAQSVEVSDRQPTLPAVSATLRGLDTLNGEVRDMTLRMGETVRFGQLEITVETCRVPQDAPTADASAFLRIRDVREAEPRFSGWMFASSPALSALDHPRYDVWVLSCSTS